MAIGLRVRRWQFHQHQLAGGIVGAGIVAALALVVLAGGIVGGRLDGSGGLATFGASLALADFAKSATLFHRVY